MKLHAFLLASVLAAGSLSLVFAQQPPQPRPAQPAPARAALQQSPRCIPQDPEAVPPVQWSISSCKGLTITT